MELKPIRTKKDHQAALAEADRLWDVPAKSLEADRLGVLTVLTRSNRDNELRVRRKMNVRRDEPKRFTNGLRDQ